MTCPYCLQNLQDRYKFCTHCGRNIINKFHKDVNISYENHIERIVTKTPITKVLFRVYASIFVIGILIFICFMSNRFFSYHNANKSYFNMMKNIENNKLIDAYLDLEKVKLYQEEFKDVQTIEAYLNAKEMINSQKNTSYEQIEQELNKIKNDYNGDMSSSIQLFKQTFLLEKEEFEDEKLNQDIKQMKKLANERFTFSVFKRAIDKYILECPVKITNNYIYEGQSNPTVSISTFNKSNRVVIYYDIIYFSYDNQNKPIVDEYNENSYYCSNDDKLIPNGIFDGTEWSWEFDGFAGTERFVPIISYVEFEDGSTWQLPSEVENVLQYYADNVIGKTLIESGY